MKDCQMNWKNKNHSYIKMRNHFLSKTKIPDELPKSMENAIEELKRTSSQEECLKKAYEIMTKRFRGHRFKTITRIPQIFSFDIESFWNTPGFMLCHNMAWLLRILLVKSGHFENEDLISKWTQVWYISPHNYLKVKMKSGKVINVDTWGASQGIKFGEYAHGIH